VREVIALQLVLPGRLRRLPDHGLMVMSPRAYMASWATPACAASSMPPTRMYPTTSGCWLVY
jgi:hypothetical protein